MHIYLHIMLQSEDDWDDVEDEAENENEDGTGSAGEQEGQEEQNEGDGNGWELMDESTMHGKNVVVSAVLVYIVCYIFPFVQSIIRKMASSF